MSKAVVVLDPGHGGYDPGAVAHGLKEKDLNLALGLAVAERLEEFKVLLTRDRDVFVSLADRVALSRRAEADLFLSLHANAGGGRGFESFAYSGLKPGHRAFVAQKSLHAEVIGVLKSWDIIDRGLKQAAFYVLKHNPAPAVLIESLFIDNEREAGIWQEKHFVQTLATGVIRGVRSALGLSPENGADAAPKPRPDKPEHKSLYTVQVGAFAYIDNARQRLAEAREAGFDDAYIYHKHF